jgi:hypothetical protein
MGEMRRDAQTGSRADAQTGSEVTGSGADAQRLVLREFGRVNLPRVNLPGKLPVNLQVNLVRPKTCM